MSPYKLCSMTYQTFIYAKDYVIIQIKYIINNEQMLYRIIKLLLPMLQVHYNIESIVRRDRVMFRNAFKSIRRAVLSELRQRMSALYVQQTCSFILFVRSFLDPLYERYKTVTLQCLLKIFGRQHADRDCFLINVWYGRVYMYSFMTVLF